MGENRGFGKSGRNEGHKASGRGGKISGARSSNFGAASGGGFGAPRGSGFGAPRGAKSDNAARDTKNDGAVNFRSYRPKDAQGDSRPADARGGRPKDAQGDSRPADARGNRSRWQDASGFKGAPRTEKPYGFGKAAFQGERKDSEYKRNDRPYRPKDTRNKSDDIHDSRNFAGDDNTLGFQEDVDKLEGRNSVLEALKAGRSINRIFVAKGDREGSVNQIIAMARQSHILIQEIDRSKLDAISQTQSHQGVIALAAAKDYVEVDEILASAAASGRPPFIIILDEITDSYNLGSILRTANAAGVHGVIIPKRRAVGLTSAVSKASAGAIEYIPVARVTNIVQTIKNLKKQNIWVVGTDSSGEKSYFERDLTGPVALVIGSEGEGMGKLVRESCDFVVNIPMLGQISSLNAAVAGAIVTYEILRQRSKKQL